MNSYQVTWEIDIEAETPEAAAREALKIQRDPKSIATVFDVTRSDEEGEVEWERIDLSELDAHQEEDYAHDPRTSD